MAGLPLCCQQHEGISYIQFTHKYVFLYQLLIFICYIFKSVTPDTPYGITVPIEIRIENCIRINIGGV